MNPPPSKRTRSSSTSSLLARFSPGRAAPGTSEIKTRVTMESFTAVFPLPLLHQLMLVHREAPHRHPRVAAHAHLMKRRQVPRPHALPAILHRLRPQQPARSRVPVMHDVAARQEEALGGLAVVDGGDGH